MTATLPLIPQDKKAYDLIDLTRWNRQESFSFFMKTGTQVHLSASVPFEAMSCYLATHNLRRFSTILYLLWRCANEVEALRVSAVHHSGEDKPREAVLFRELDLSFPVLNREGIPINTLVHLDPAFETSYQRITAAIDSVRSGKSENMFADGHPCLLASHIPYPFDDCEMTSIHKHMLVPTVIVGTPRKREGLDVLPVALSIHHAFADGMDLVAFFKKLEAYFQHPEKVLC